MRIFSALFVGFGLALAQASGASPDLVPTNVLAVMNLDGEAVSGAKVMIGYGPGDPFDGNIFTADDMGTVDIPAQWKTPLPITVEAASYTRTTFVESLPMGRTLTISYADAPDFLELRGRTDGYGSLRTDGKVDVGLIMPTYSRRDLLNFDISSIISPETDVIEVLGKEVDVPSNLSLPRQRETYYLPITLNKPDYRIYSRKSGEQTFLAGHVQFPLKKVLDKLRRNGTILDVVNDFNFLGGGLETVTLDASSTRQNFDVSTMSFKSGLSIEAPAYDGNYMMFSVAVAEKEGRMYPTDLKFLESNERLEMRTDNRSERNYIASLLTHRPEEEALRIDIPIPGPGGLLNEVSMNPVDTLVRLALAPEVEEKKTDFNQMSITIYPAGGLVQPRFLPLVEKPEMNASGELILSPPSSIPGVQALGTYVILSAVETIDSGKLKSEKRTRLWEVVAPNWLDRVSLPEIDLDEYDGVEKRWEVLYLGQQSEQSGEELGGLESVTHVTRNAVSFQ